MTEMEREGAKRGTFNMAKEDGIEACRAHRAALEADGKNTWLEHFTGDLFTVKHN